MPHETKSTAPAEKGIRKFMKWLPTIVVIGLIILYSVQYMLVS